MVERKRCVGADGSLLYYPELSDIQIFDLVVYQTVNDSYCIEFKSGLATRNHKRSVGLLIEVEDNNTGQIVDIPVFDITNIYRDNRLVYTKGEFENENLATSC